MASYVKLYNVDIINMFELGWELKIIKNQAKYTVFLPGFFILNFLSN